MSGRLRVAVDLDQTAGAFTDAMRESVAGMLGVPAESLHADPAYDFREWGITDRFADFQRNATTVDRVFRNMAVHDGVGVALRRLEAEADAQIAVVTARLFVPGLHGMTISDTVAWLDEHDLPYHDLHVLRGKGVTKTDTVQFDVLIDDKPDEVLAARAAGRIGIVFGDYSYNRFVDGPRAVSWEQVPDLVLGLWRARKDVQPPAVMAAS